jgi:hypothetical protein
MTRRALVAAIIATAVATMPTPASSKLRCHGPYLVNSQGEVRTPYCEYEYLARVAGEHGYHTTGDRLHKDYGDVREACGLVFMDNRVTDICQSAVPQLSNPNCGVLPCF